MAPVTLRRPWLLVPAVSSGYGASRKRVRQLPGRAPGAAYTEAHSPVEAPVRPQRRRPPTSRDVAHRAGVSRATVSYVLNDVPDSRISETTRERVREAAQKLGYIPHAMARSLRIG